MLTVSSYAERSPRVCFLLRRPIKISPVHHLPYLPHAFQRGCDTPGSESTGTATPSHHTLTPPSHVPDANPRRKHESRLVSATVERGGVKERQTDGERNDARLDRPWSARVDDRRAVQSTGSTDGEDRVTGSGSPARKHINETMAAHLPHRLPSFTETL
ncbi:hypothetical protein SKAU_G00335830 [Synaphobranchus kaupii]|uniref:Uncharacterized protein n=1 Tax=Synaphobranchus kaupii TaxID=118154 RepID=A0A9Q1EM27_SYNKA|nr:hypothetical protein SKAU_G00335830 [Synaphobranchus kaupii]